MNANILASIFQMWKDFEEGKIKPYQYLKNMVEEMNRLDTEVLLEKAQSLSDKDMIYMAGKIHGRRDVLNQVEGIIIKGQE